MAQRVKASAPSMSAAVARVVAQLVDSEPDDVVVKIEAPGFDDEHEVTLRAEVVAPDVDPSGEDADDGAVAHDEAVREDEDAAPDDTTSEEAARDEDDGDDAAASASEDVVPVEVLDEEADAAADFLERVLDILELPGDLQIRIHDDHAEVEIVGVGGGELIGRRGTTLEALQELLRCSLQRRFERRVSVKMDVEGYRSRRLEKIEQKVEEAVDDVLDSGDAYRLEPMDVFERKAVHQAVATYEGVVSRSQGREPSRRVVIEPAD